GLRREAQRKARALAAAHEVPLTVVIPTYNRRDILKKTLLAFSAQTVAPAEFEVVVVDDGSTDDTLAMLAALRTPFALRVLAEPACDDIELGYRLRRQGMVLHFRPQAVTYHHHELTTAGFVRRQRMAGRMSVVLTRKHPELDAALTRVVEQARASDALDAAGLERMLEAVLELEKPDLDKLGVLRTGEESFAAVYRRAVLDPLYATLLQAAYRLG